MLCGTACPDKVGISRHSGEKYSLRKYCLIIFSLVLVFKVTGIAQTDIPAGNVSGTWTKVNSPYHINGEVTIPNDSILTIWFIVHLNMGRQIQGVVLIDAAVQF